MSYRAVETIRARQDKQQIVDWLSAKSLAGSWAWLEAYDQMIERLRNSPEMFAAALERKDVQLDVRQALFKTRGGRFYRALFYISGDNVIVLRVRAPGQASLTPDELN